MITLPSPAQARAFRENWYGFRAALEHVGHELYQSSLQIKIRVMAERLLIEWQEPQGVMLSSVRAQLGNDEAAEQALAAIQADLQPPHLKVVEDGKVTVDGHTFNAKPDMSAFDEDDAIDPLEALGYAKEEKDDE